MLVALMLVALVAAFPRPGYAAKKASSAEARAEKIARSVTIYRDSYGVPHIYGPTDASCVFGFIYSQAEDNFWQIEDSYIRALGRASEVYGDRTLADDMLNRALEIPRLGKAEYDRTTDGRESLPTRSPTGSITFSAHNPQSSRGSSLTLSLVPVCLQPILHLSAIHFWQIGSESR